MPGHRGERGRGLRWLSQWLVRGLIRGLSRGAVRDPGGTPAFGAHVDATDSAGTSYEVRRMAEPGGFEVDDVPDDARLLRMNSPKPQRSYCI